MFSFISSKNALILTKIAKEMTAENEREIYHKLEAMKEIRYYIFLHDNQSKSFATSHLWTRSINT